MREYSVGAIDNRHGTSSLLTLHCQGTSRQMHRDFVEVSSRARSVPLRLRPWPCEVDVARREKPRSRISPARDKLLYTREAHGVSYLNK